MKKLHVKNNGNIFLLVSDTMNHFSYFDTKHYAMDLRYNMAGQLLWETDAVRDIKTPARA